MTAEIFVSIASYRDPELSATIENMLTRASQPERLQIYVLSQVLPEDKSCLAPEYPQVHEQIMPADASRGVCYARHLIQQKLPESCDYFLQIDSHMRFAENWDERLIEMLAQCPQEKALLSCYPVGYRPPDKLGKPMISHLVPKKFNHQGILILDSATTDYASRPAIPAESAFVAAGFIFGPADAYREVEYDPHLYFAGEEITLSARFWTHGWHFYAPNDVLIYHNYHPQKRPRHWDDDEQWQMLNRLSVERIHYLLAGQAVEHPEALAEVAKYGLGDKRTLEAFQRYCGITFADGVRSASK